MIKAKTIEQFKILTHIRENFYIEELQIELIGTDKVRIRDKNGDSAVFHYKRGILRCVPEE